MSKNVVSIKDIEKLSPFFKGKTGNDLGRFAMHLCSIDRVNDVYNRSSQYSGAKFAASLLDDLGVNYRIGNAERLNILPEGAFITISNHPYGGLDGIMLVDLMASIRQDYKLMVNHILSLVKTMEENFISVEPRLEKDEGIKPINLQGVRKTLTHLHNGHPMGFFPSGAVSDLNIKKGCIEDRTWQKSIIKLIKTAEVPIVPIRFFDGNSPLFYSLGLINWKLRLTRMSYEIFNKRKQNPRIGIGEFISVEEQNRYKDVETFSLFLRNSVYNMPIPEFFVPKKLLSLQKL